MSTPSILDDNGTYLNSTSTVTYKKFSAANRVSYEIYYIKIIVVSVVSVAIVLSNALNIYILSRNSHIPKISIIFLLNLSTSDLCVGLISCIPTIISSIIGFWPYGSVWCQIAGIFHGTSCAISIWSISMVSIERYLAICKPMTAGNWRSPRKAYAVIACLWTLALVTFISPPMSKPEFLYYKFSVDENMCGLHWEYKWFCVLTGVYIPIFSGSVLVFTNFKIMRKIVTRHDDLGKINCSSSVRRRGMSAVKLLISTSAIYFLAWGPYVTEVFLTSFSDDIRVPGTVKFALMWLANSNSFMNVITFSVVYRSFRDEIKNLFLKHLCCLTITRKLCQADERKTDYSTSEHFQESQSMQRRNGIGELHVDGADVSSMPVASISSL